jgi:hypothetical protein
MTTLYLIVPGRPIAKPRMTNRDRWELRAPVDAYRRHVDAVRAAVVDAKREAGMGDFDLWHGSVEVQVTFLLDATHVTVTTPALPARPVGLSGDLDNLVKTVFEGLHPQRGSLSTSILQDDRQVVGLQAAIRPW